MGTRRQIQEQGAGRGGGGADSTQSIQDGMGVNDCPPKKGKMGSQECTQGKKMQMFEIHLWCKPLHSLDSQSHITQYFGKQT